MSTEDANSLPEGSSGNDSGAADPVSLHEDIHQVNISDEMEEAYLNYSMSVLIGRALPDARDGFKPVHRRVLYAMWRLGNRHDVPYKKSARVVGDVIGKYHPHGDTAVYDTIVRMAQPFSLRYPLVDGHGNFGTIDRDPAAAMRYTEVRLSRIAEEMLTDIDRDTVDMTPNFDGTEKEPSVLPARFPQLLVNGSQGIAVGMATNIPTHNLGETIDACLYALHHPEASVDDLIRFMPAPDFPTGGIIFGLSGVRQAYRTGRGSVLIRAKVHEETDDKGRTSIVVDEIPYMVNKAELIKKIAALRNEKKIDGITDLRDESSKDIRIVIELRRDAHPEAVKNNLFKLTDLQTTFGVNMVALLDGRPQLLNLKQLVDAFIGLRREVVTRRTRFLLAKARAEGHLQEGLAIALANIDEFIEIIKSSSDRAEATDRLMNRGWKAQIVNEMIASVAGNYQDYRPQDIEGDRGLRADGLYWLSREQTDRILDMRLQTLTATQQESIIAAYKELCAQITDYLDILAHDERIVKIINDDLLYIKEKYGDARRTAIDPSGDPDFDELDLIPQKDLVVTLSRDGYVKSQLLSDYQAQRRGGQGRKSGKFRDQDAGDQLIVTNTHDQLLCFTSFGRMYLINHAYMVPTGTAGSKGRPIQNLIALQQFEKSDGRGDTVKALEKVTNILAIPTPDENHCVFFSTARAPVRSQLLRLSRDEVRLQELPADVSESIRRDVAAFKSELPQISAEKWDATALADLPATAQAEIKGILKWGTEETEAARKEAGNSKTWSEMKVSDLPAELRAQARSICDRGLGELAALKGEDWGRVTLGELPAKARNTARDAFRLSLLSDFAREHFVFFATARGIVKKVPLSEFSKVQNGGTSAVSLDPDDQLIGAELTDGHHDIMLFSDAGKAVRFDENDVRPMGRTARGVGGMRIRESDRIIALIVAGDEDRMVLTATENGFGKRTPIAEYTRHGRNTQGMIAIATTERNGRVVGACLVSEEDEIILLSEKGHIVRTPVADIRVCSRAAQGVTLIGLKDDRLVSVTPVQAGMRGEEPAENGEAEPQNEDAGIPADE
ncbi:MAG: DNA gyrase subunit A [Mesosutterella sp.]|nr:DNA gyrase subunit A [Mesosutterella sp.]